VDPIWRMEAPLSVSATGPHRALAGERTQRCHLRPARRPGSRLCRTALVAARRAHRGAHLQGDRAAPRRALTDRVPATMVRVVINGRFLAQVQTGVQRYGRQTLLALDELLTQRPELQQALQLELAVPAGAKVPALRNVKVHVLPLFRGHIWEQVSLAWFARG